MSAVNSSQPAASAANSGPKTTTIKVTKNGDKYSAEIVKNGAMSNAAANAASSAVEAAAIGSPEQVAEIKNNAMKIKEATAASGQASLSGGRRRTKRRGSKRHGGSYKKGTSRRNKRRSGCSRRNKRSSRR